MEVTIRHRETGLSMVLSIGEEETVGSLKQKVMHEFLEDTPQRLALMLKGDDEEMGADNESVRQCILESGQEIDAVTGVTKHDRRESDRLLKLRENLSSQNATAILDGSELTQEQLLEKAVAMDPYNSAALARLTLVQLFREGRVPHEDVYKQAIEIDPNYSHAFNNLGVRLHADSTTTLLDGTVMSKEALYKRAISLDPFNALAFHNLGKLLPPGGSTELECGREMTREQLLGMHRTLRVQDVVPKRHVCNCF